MTASVKRALVPNPVIAGRNRARVSAHASRVVRARTVAVRGTSRIRAISPKKSPAPSVRSSSAVLEDLGLA